MKIPDYYFPIMEMKYRQMLDEQRQVASIAKTNLLTFDTKILEPQRQHEEDRTKFEIAIKLWAYFKDAVFYQDEEAFRKIKRLLYKAKHFLSLSRWFVSLEDLHKQYEAIRKHNIKIDSLLAYTFIKGHLVAKFANELLMIYVPRERDEVVMSKLTNDLLNLKKRRDYSGSNPKRYKDIYEVVLNDLTNEFTNFTNKDIEINLQFDINVLIQHSKGKTEASMLRTLVKECFIYDFKKINTTKFLSVIFDLLVLLMPDRNFMTQQDFDEAMDITYKNYNSYKSQTIKKILYPKKNPSMFSPV